MPTVCIVRGVWIEVCTMRLLKSNGVLIFLFSQSHFGSDTTGVNATRRYLCEALSFMHRYVPIGLLEVLPGRLNDRPPSFKGRDELGASRLALISQLLYLLITSSFSFVAPSLQKHS